MGYREHGMWEILAVLRQAHEGVPYRQIARSRGLSRNTVRRYLGIAKELGWIPGTAPPGEPLAVGVLSRSRPGGTGGRQLGETGRLLREWQERLQKWLEPRSEGGGGLRLVKCQELLRRQGVVVPYSSLHRFAVEHCGFGGRRITVRMAEVEPGELAEVDFGKLGLIPVKSLTGGRRTLYALVVTLVYSRHQYVHLTHSQDLSALIDGLEDAWEFFGGVPRRVILDNLKAAITKADRYDPTINRTFDEYAGYRGFVIDPARVRDPQGKPHVERQVPYVRENFFRGESFFHRDHAQEAAIRWCLSVAGTRTHGTTRKHPVEEFEKYEKAALLPLTGERFDTPVWATPKVHPDHHVRFGKALYSVPTAFLREKVTVRGDRGLVRIYHRGKLIKVHPRVPEGKRSTDYEDYPKEKSDYAMRCPDALISRARKQGKEIGILMTRLLEGEFPWARLRQAQKLLRLGEKYGVTRLEAACHRALAFDLIDVFRVERMIRHGLESEALPQNTSLAQVHQIPLRFERKKGSFTPPIQKESDDGNQ